MHALAVFGYSLLLRCSTSNIQGRVRPVLTGYELVTKKRNQSIDWLRSGTRLTHLAYDGRWRLSWDTF